jgi:hypothetical protein
MLFGKKVIFISIYSILNPDQEGPGPISSGAMANHFHAKLM